jgi:dTDP-4-dehydrorhamnose 3,5-epimerase-like enzyme
VTKAKFPIKQISTNRDSRGSLGFLELDCMLDGSCKRIFYIRDTKQGISRGNHAHKKCTQVLIAVSGAFQIIINKGMEEKEIIENQYLHIPPLHWIEINPIIDNSILLVLCDREYEKDDYIYDFKVLEDHNHD